MKTHFALYQGYVTNTNRLIETLNSLLKEGKGNTPEFAELKRRFGWEFNGMRLHEYFFSEMSKQGKELSKDSSLYKKMERDFGSYENWVNDFKSTATMRGIGWTILYHDRMNDRLFNSFINEHDTGHLAGCAPILVLDLFEHAYMKDYGTKKADYVEAFFKIIDFEQAEKKALSIKCGCSIVAIMTLFQGVDEGSIPFTRS